MHECVTLFYITKKINKFWNLTNKKKQIAKKLNPTMEKKKPLCEKLARQHVLIKWPATRPGLVYAVLHYDFSMDVARRGWMIRIQYDNQIFNCECIYTGEREDCFLEFHYACERDRKHREKLPYEENPCIFLPYYNWIHR